MVVNVTLLIPMTGVEFIDCKEVGKLTFVTKNHFLFCASLLLFSDSQA